MVVPVMVVVVGVGSSCDGSGVNGSKVVVMAVLG